MQSTPFVIKNNSIIIKTKEAEWEHEREKCLRDIGESNIHGRRAERVSERRRAARE